MRNEISDQSIVDVIKRVSAGVIQPEWQTHVFKLNEYKHIGVTAPDEEMARYALLAANVDTADLVRIEQQTFEGWTYLELLEEGRKRGLLDGEHI